MGQHCANVRVGMPTLRYATAADLPYSTALTIDSITFLASPNTIIVFGM
jgi:hypothetical protein